jgi:hypothetical protein
MISCKKSILPFISDLYICTLISESILSRQMALCFKFNLTEGILRCVPVPYRTPSIYVFFSFSFVSKGREEWKDKHSFSFLLSLLFSFFPHPTGFKRLGSTKNNALKEICEVLSSLRVG